MSDLEIIKFGDPVSTMYEKTRKNYKSMQPIFIELVKKSDINTLTEGDVYNALSAVSLLMSLNLILDQMEENNPDTK